MASGAVALVNRLPGVIQCAGHVGQLRAVAGEWKIT
jgi:hypothetical protein